MGPGRTKSNLVKEGLVCISIYWRKKSSQSDIRPLDAGLALIRGPEIQSSLTLFDWANLSKFDQSGCVR